MASEPAYTRIVSTSDGRRRKSFEELWDDLLLVPEGYIGEIVDGEIVEVQRPRHPHTFAASNVGFLLGPPFGHGAGGPGGWIVLHEPGIRFGDDMRIPDLAGWCVERFVVPPGDEPYRVPPDWICEALSPSTARSDRLEKLPLYALHGVGHVWLVDAVLRTLEVYRLEQGRWTLLGVHGGDDKVRAEPFEAVELDLALLWGPAPAAAR